jgi:hypothetical protein
MGTGRFTLGYSADAHRDQDPSEGQSEGFPGPVPPNGRRPENSGVVSRGVRSRR